MCGDLVEPMILQMVGPMMLPVGLQMVQAQAQAQAQAQIDELMVSVSVSALAP